MHRIAILVLSLLYAPLYFVIYVITAASNLGGGGVHMDDVLFAGWAGAGLGALAWLVSLGVTRARAWQRASAGWALWIVGAAGAPWLALQFWEEAPRILWTPPVIVLVLGGISWKVVASPGVAPSLEN